MNKVIHVEFIKQEVDRNKHFYFGSKSAIFDTFSVEDIGISFRALSNTYNLNKEPYRNKKCIIRQGELIRKKTNRGIKGNML